MKFDGRAFVVEYILNPKLDSEDDRVIFIIQF